MGFRMNYIFIWCLLASIYSSKGCTMEGVTTWQLPITVRIEDYLDGIVLQRSISDITGFTLSSFSDLNGGPYIVASIENSAFVLRTNEAYRLFEEYETADLISLTYAFTCANGQNPASPLTFRIEINDNNNNAPLFKTADTVASETTTYDFTIATPVPPGFLITNCVSDIIVRDIDLTTYRIDFSIEDNPYISIEYDEAASTEAKEFKAVLRSTSFIRSIPEPITLTISATDVDQTGDPPITRSTTVTIHGDSEFEMPQEPVFSQAFYLASYTESNQVTVEQPILLEQGYDEHVQFSLEGDYSADHFGITVNNNLVTLSVTNPLPTAVLQEGQIYLVIHATREYTSGASATVIVQLPEAEHLEFERPHYEGEIVDNALQLTQLVLSQGYQGSAVAVTVEDYSAFFAASVVGNTITLSMTPLDDSIIQENNFINLRVTAITDYSAATAIVTLEIVKDDVTTPVFDQTLYTGTYDPTAGLTVDPVLLVRGYDDTVTISLSGEYESYFELTRDGPSSTLRVAGDGLPAHILSQSHIHLSVQAAKPRTVGASAVVAITLPGAREMQFEAQSYRGSVQDNILTLDTITLSVGYDEDVTFSLSGDYSTSFSVSNVQNQMTINMPTQLPQEVISENNFLMLTLTAEGPNALPTTTAVLLDIIKVDATTPVFSQPIYEGTYLGPLGIDLGNINLIQGYDSDVTFRIQGDNSEYFTLTQNENSVTLTVQSSIPEEVIFQEKAFVFNIFADKPLTVGANAAIVIKFSEDLVEPTVMQFAKNTYVGSLENNELTLENVVLETGYAVGTQFYLSGDYEASFTFTVTNNIVTLSMTSGLPAEVLENNKFIVLELEARRDRAVSVGTGIIIDIVGEEIEVPVFSQAYYTGIYTEENALEFQEIITLIQGYDDTVTFGLEGESAAWFSVAQNGNSATLLSSSPVPEDVLDSNHQILFNVVAYKSNTINGHAAISIELPTELLEQEVLRFDQSSYEGQLDGAQLQVPTITLSNEITENVIVSLSGAYATYFTATRNSNTIQIELVNELSSEIISNNEFIVLDITASKTDAVSGYTALILSIVKEPTIVTPVFEQPYYTGEITEQDGLLFEHTIRLIQGFDETVSFALSGDESERFTLTQTGQNSLSISVTEGGMEAIENISHFVFYVVANKAGSVSGHAAIIIYNTDSSTARNIRFSQNHYKGSLEENILTMESINIVEGYSSDVILTLNGDYVEYFQLVGQEGTYTLQLVSNIPNEIVETQTVLVYTVEAIGDNARTHATVIIELIKDNYDEIEALAFEEAYYVGSYSATSGVMDNIQLRVVNGYESDAVFTLQGDNSAWFNVQHSESIVTISLTAPLPVELFIDNLPVIFTVNGINSGGRIATATIVVSIQGDLAELTVLGFERNSYLGTIVSDTSTLQAITLTQGYSSEVQFTLHGDLSNYFIINQQSSTVNVELQSAIPEQELTENRVILLELQATAAEAVSATATIVFDVVVGQELSFSATHYIGHYTETEGLVFDSTISLDAGYDQDVQFTLEGEHSQWFALQVQGNVISLSLTSTIPAAILAHNHQLIFNVEAHKPRSNIATATIVISLIDVQGNAVTLTTSSAIPPAILVNNHQLVFSVTAQKPNSNTAMATMVISLVDDYTDATILGFERASYLGSIENDELSLDPIILNEGYTDTVTFTLSGDLASYFTLQQQGSTVNIILQNVIPEQTLPSNGIMLLELRASAPDAIPAITTVVIEAQREANVVEELAFSAAYYIGEYSEISGLAFDSIITLDVGYDQNVQFALEGEHAQWFALEVQGNAVTLTTSSAIPPAILVNNHQLVFSVTARKPNSNIAMATMVVSLVDDYTDATILGFERASYLGSIENDELSLDRIILNEGYTDTVTFTLSGDLASYFTLQQQGSTVNIILQNVIPEQTLPSNGIMLLELRASAPDAIPAITTVVIEAQREANVVEELAFSAAYYIGEYSEISGLAFDSIITLDMGYDQNVQFALEGEHAQWFALEVQGNAVTLTTSSAIPPAILVNNHQLVFSVTARKPNSNTAMATMVVSLVDDYTDATILGFERASYLGSIENDELSLDPIILNEGYTDTVTFTLSGDLASYFTLQQQGSTVNIILQNVIPEQTLPSNGIMLLELRASAPDAIPAITTVVIEAQREANVVEELSFSAAYYIGEYSEISGLAFDSIITLDVGYDQNVQFALEGEHAQWFALEVQGNAVTLTTSSAIPPAILVNNHQLVFSVTARKPNSNIAMATMVVSLVDDYTDATILGFERASYLGSIENDELSLDPIILNEGYTDTVTFTLSGDLASYFTLRQQGSTVNIILQNVIPEQTLPSNGIMLLELRASAPDAIPAITTVVIEAQREANVVEELAFSAAYYIGEYSEISGLAFDSIITVDVGYDQNVQFALEGEHAQWFALEVQGNAVTLTTSSAIPPAILVNNHQLVFSVTARKPNSNTAMATMVVSLVDDYTDATILGFERASYLGSIENDELSLDPIILNEGYTDTVTFTLSGDLASYFTLQQQGSTVNIILQNVIPEQTLPSNGIMLLELRASAPDAIPATTTVVIEAQREANVVEELAFSAAYYIGEYSEISGLAFDSIITLDVGYDQNVQFALEGEHAQWFALEVQGNAVTLTTSSAIPPATLVNNHQLVFSVTARKPNSNTAMATMVVSLVDDYTDATILGFERASYLGSIENDELSLDPIILNEGYTDTVTFTLSGDLASYFTLQQQGSTINIILQNVIPEQTLPSNGIMLLELRASAPDAIPATTTVVIEAQREANVVEELAFSAAYYIGEYSEISGLAFDSIITLDVGYDQNVQFALEGEHAQWFALEVQGNAVTLTTSSAIPPAILVNNHQLVFSVTARKPNSNTAMATMVVSLVDDYTDATILGFERASYLGSIENDELSLDPIILNEGYTDTVTFTLSGDLASYFTLQQQGSTVNIILQNVIPEQTLPSNGIMLLELRASAPDAIPATTTVVIEAQREANVVEELAFSAAYYIGEYSEISGLAFDSIITLDVGYDQNVQFALEGEHCQWFALEVQGNAVTLTTSSAIPPAILVNNHQLVFSVTARKPNSNTAMATMVVSLVDDYTDATILEFERASYLGSIKNDELSLDPIILNEGYTDTVTFTLSGDLASYFTLQQEGSTVNIILQNVIPEQTLPSNGIMLLELRASAPDAIPATTTVVIEAQREANVVEELAFSAAYYIGEYSEISGLAFDSIITLDVGYDQNVQFALEGEHAQWFALEVQGNAVTLTTSSAIPPAIVVNNHQLVFSVTARKPNSNTAMAIMVVSLVDDYTDATILGFERASYLGSIENDVLSLDPIILNEGYTDTVTFTLSGDLASYFTLQQEGSIVNIILQNVIPEQTLPSNGIMLLELRASAPDAIPATTTVVIEAQREANVVEELAFSAAYYIGEYSEISGLAFDSIITLDVGYDQNVQFVLEGEHVQWFALEVQGNAVTLTTSSAIPPAILVNNHQLVFSVTARKPNSNTAMATMVVSLVDDYTDATILGFERASYLGSIKNDELSLDPIILNEGYTDTVTFTLSGDLASYFTLQQEGSTVNIILQNVIPEQTLPSNGIMLLELRASAPDAIPATTTVVIEAQREANVVEELAFSAAYYIGEYSEISGLAFDSIITLDVGYDQNVQFALEGEHAQWFALEVQGNAVTLTTSSAIPPAIVVNNHQLVFSVTARKPNSNTAMAIMVVSLVDDYTDATILGFERASYLGSIENDELSLDPIILNEGYTDTVTFTLSGDLASYFTLQQEGSTVNIILQNVIPEQTLPSNGIMLLELRASAPDAIPATTTVVIEAQREANVVEELAFSAAYYIGEYSEISGLAFDSIITLDVGYDQNVQFALEGEHAQWFALEVQGNAFTLTTSSAIPPAILVNNHQLVFSVTARKPNSNTAMATMVVSLVDDYTDATILGFERASYLGSIENGALSIEPIVLIEGYTDAVTFTLSGDLSSYFNIQQQGSTVNILLQSVIPEELLPVNRILLLELRASAPQAVPVTTAVVLEARRNEVEELAFNAAYYTGEYSESGGLVFDNSISLDAGYDQAVLFSLEGDHAQWFALSVVGNSITLFVTEPIPPAALADLRKIIMMVRAVKSEAETSAIIVISIINDSGSVINEAFDKVLYEGTINNDLVQHEPITITGHAAGVNIEIIGVYRELFSATLSGNTVVIGGAGTLNLPESVTNVALELRAGSASAVLIFDVTQSETPELPTVAFGSPTYVLRTDMAQTGLLGQVQATASNGESIAYSLAVDDAHLRERISINSVGEIHLSAPTNTGVYSFDAIATSTITQVQATAMVQLTVEAAAICGDDHALPPLIILDRDEEEPHANLVVLDSVAQAGCQFRLTNRWPLDQDWIYVDDTGVHARAIDREDPRIALMALSQVQVELVLECASDTQSRVKRSTMNPRLDWLGPYEYGNNKWILTDTILYNSRRSFVNLIVNDINDNYPIFVGNENEPVICGYPIPELQNIVLPRALAELKATDADVGENAALSFWSSSEALAVASTTGFVHVRDGASLTHDQSLTVSVTDLNGREDGLTTSIELLVKLLDTSHIAVVTVRNAFLDQEETILGNLSSAVGYEVKVLSSAVISDDPADSANARRKRQVTAEGASLQLYVYGVIDREPVAVDQLANDITENVSGVDVTSTVSLEDYLEGREIYRTGRDTGLLVSTIVLSILLFILMLLIALWFFLRWRKARNYDQFSDVNSLASRNEPIEPPPKVDSLRKPRLNIDELKRSERRLQEMLDAPIDEVGPKAQTSKADPEQTVDTIINISPNRATDVAVPIVIQSIDKLKDDENSEEEDEFGERKNKSRRKSVVTFNENVEKIIHVEDIPDDNSSDVEVHKF